MLGLKDNRKKRCGVGEGRGGGDSNETTVSDKGLRVTGIKRDELH